MHLARRREIPHHRFGRAVVVDRVDDERQRRRGVRFERRRPQRAVVDVAPHPRQHAADLGMREEVDRPLLLVAPHLRRHRDDDEEKDPEQRQRDDDLHHRVAARAAARHHKPLPPVSARAMPRCASRLAQRMVSVTLRTSCRGAATFTTVVYGFNGARMPRSDLKV